MKYLTAEAYIADPCGASSLSYRKTTELHVPDSVTIVRDDAFCGVPEGLTDTVYFKLRHNLRNLQPAPVPDGYSIVHADTAAFARHINACYSSEGVTPGELERYKEHDAYRAYLWIALQINRTGEIAATGIAEIDASIGEGTLEWIQVSPAHRRRSLGRWTVNELLCRMRDEAAFATVSGRADNPTDPFGLYRRCGFTDPVYWHIIKEV